MRRSLDQWFVAACVVTAVALVLRITGIGYGLPFHYHWDEPTILNRVIRMGGGDLNPHFFPYPTLLMYVFLIAQGGLYAIGRAVNLYASADSFLVSYLTDSTLSYVVARTVVAVAGTATVFVTYMVGRRFISPAVGVLGALLLAVSPVHVANSHFATTDIPMAFMATLSFLFLWQVYQRGLVRDYLVAGLVIGLGVSTKYMPAVLLLSLGLAHLLRLWRSGGPWTIRQLILWPAVAGAVAFAAFAVTSPYVLLDWATALQQYRNTAQIDGASGCVNCGFNFETYLTHTLGWSVGWPAYLLALVGLLSVPFLRAEQRTRYILLASWPVLLFVAIGSARQPWPRWLAPIAPFVCLAAAAVLLRARRWVAEYQWGSLLASPNRRWRPATASAVLAAAGAAVLMVPPSISSVRYDASLLQQDPRTAAVLWFHDHVPAGTRVAVQPMLDRYFFTAQLPTESDLATEESWIPPDKAQAQKLLESTYRSRPVYDDVLFTYDYAQLKAEGVRYVVISSAHFHNVDPAAEDQLYRELNLHAKAVHRFAPKFVLADAEFFPVTAPVITVYEMS